MLLWCAAEIWVLLGSGWGYSVFLGKTTPVDGAEVAGRI